jgi:hypothetical protein
MSLCKSDFWEEAFILLMVSGDSVQGQLDPLLWACCEAEYLGRRAWQRGVSHLMVARE